MPLSLLFVSLYFATLALLLIAFLRYRSRRQFEHERRHEALVRQPQALRRRLVLEREVDGPQNEAEEETEGVEAQEGVESEEEGKKSSNKPSRKELRKAEKKALRKERARWREAQRAEKRKREEAMREEAEERAIQSAEMREKEAREDAKRREAARLMEEAEALLRAEDEKREIARLNQIDAALTRCILQADRVIDLYQKAQENGVTVEKIHSKIQSMTARKEVLGVFDGNTFVKFRFVELEQLANYINSRGRITTFELISECNRMIQEADEKKVVV